MDNHIVILGGMGPQASLKLHEYLITRFVCANPGARPDEFPGILHASLPVPDFIASHDRYEEAVEIVSSACKQLPLSTAAAVGIACNTAHMMVDRLPLVSTNFVSMIDAVVTYAKRLQVSRVGLLASPHTIESGLYRNAFRNSGIALVEPPDTDFEELHSIISSVISGDDPRALRPRLDMLAQGLAQKGADALLLGCTELPLVGLSLETQVIDSLAVLADALLEKTSKTKV